MEKRKSSLRAILRLRHIKDEAPRLFNSAVHHCARLSALNRSLAFIVIRVKPFGGPKVERIDRPRVISLSETDECIVVRDGHVFELTERTRL